MNLHPTSEQNNSHLLQTAKLIIPENEFSRFAEDTSQFSPLHINKPDLKENECPQKLVFSLQDFELTIIQHNYNILRYGRKYHNLGNTVIFEERVSRNEWNEETYRAWMFSQTSPNCYSLRFLCREGGNKVVNYLCSCQMSKKSKILMCHHLVTGLFQLRLLLKAGHFFEVRAQNDSDSEDSEMEDDLDEVRFGGENPPKALYTDQNVLALRKKFTTGEDEETLVLKELLCQICLEILLKPVSMACHAHSICEKCVRKFLIVEKNYDRNLGFFKVHCPTCGVKGGTLRVDHEAQEFRINKEVERIRDAHIRYLEEKCLAMDRCRSFAKPKEKLNLKRKCNERTEQTELPFVRKVHSMSLRSSKKKEQVRIPEEKIGKSVPIMIDK